LATVVRRRLGVPAGRSTYRDLGDERGETLYATTLPLTGRPDVLMRRGKAIIPVEIKTGRTPAEPHLSQVVQLLAYRLLVDEHYGVRPTHGILCYPERHFRVPYTTQQEKTLREIITAVVEAERTGRELHRQHQNRHVCAGCGFKSRCPDAL
ncbi:MAG TPA: PD-(D/E)XK nuclease family protein, partial [Dehalococcoidia bacterium]|nr:PD-(D/E)XK nuclease family protein [Dehalococcoidia bacterium]